MFRRRLTALLIAALMLCLPVGQAAASAEPIAARSVKIRGAVDITRWSNGRAYAGNRQLKNSFGFDGSHYFSFETSGALRKGWYLESIMRDGSSNFDKMDKQFLQTVACLLPTPDVDAQRVCHFDETTGAMSTGWLKDGNEWLYFDPLGRMQTSGWMQGGSRGEKWYYFDGAPYWSSMQTGWLRQYSAAGATLWYYLKPSGEMATGWVKPGNKWYYLASDGRMQSDTWVKSKGYWYFLNKDGSMAAAKWVQSKGSWYYLKADGSMMYSGSMNIGGKAYNFDSNGRWIK